MKREKRAFLSGCLAAACAMALVGTAAATVGRQTVEVDYSDIKVTLDGQAVELVDANGSAVEPFAIHGTTYLPVRAVSGALGLEVGWDAETSTVVLTTPEEERPVYMTRTGEKYHYDSSCNDGTYYEVPLETAMGMGLTPCEKCVGQEE